jgi:hypothetical protein
VTPLTDKQRTVMNGAVGRLERMYITARYLELWWNYMPEDERKLHLSRLAEDLGNASQVAAFWRKFAHQNGIKLPDGD